MDRLHIGREVPNFVSTTQKTQVERGIHITIKTQIVMGKRIQATHNNVPVGGTKGVNVRKHPYTLICLILRVIYSGVKQSPPFRAIIYPVVVRELPFLFLRTYILFEKNVLKD
jgi:hypothetical protein